MTEQKKKTEVDKTTKVFFYLCAGFCISFFIWAAVSPLDIVSDAIGEVIPSSRVKKIQHLEGGIVREIKVREGDLVKVGQPLIELEATASDSTVEELNVRVSSLEMEVARLEAEAKWFADPDKVKSVDDDTKWQTAGKFYFNPYGASFSVPENWQPTPQTWWNRPANCIWPDGSDL